jgi:hypothetical protein
MLLGFLIPVRAELRLGEGTGHQRVIELIGRNIPAQKVFFNEEQSSIRRKIDTLDMNTVQWMVLHNEQVVERKEIKKMNFSGPKSHFLHLSEVIIPSGSVEKEDIWALVTK